MAYNGLVNASSSLPPSEEYKQRQRAREAQVTRFKMVHISLGNARLLLVLVGLAVAWMALHSHLFSAWWLVVPALLFVAMGMYHSKVLRRLALAQRAADVYRDGLARMEDRWVGLHPREERTDAAHSLYASDLDVFGHGSLFELLCTARTRMGEDALAGWLLAPVALREVKARQAAVAELRERLDLREEMAVLGESQKVGVHAEALLRWAEAPDPLKHTWMRWAALLLGVLAVMGAVFWGLTGSVAVFVGIVMLEAILQSSQKTQMDEIFGGSDRALQDLQLVASLLARLEREPFETPLLQALQKEFFSHHVAASQAIARLTTLVDYIESRDDLIVKLIDVPLMYSLQLAFFVQNWRNAHGKAVRVWLAALGEMEALLSIAAYSYEHPADLFPELVEGEPCFRAEELGHPLIPAAKCVRNSVELCGETRVLLISGSNMSGKSTLMRSIGINTVLAMCGAPVRAQRLQLTPLQVGASILINDSLQEGSSRFYAEIKRLRAICDLAEQHPPVLFLLDELLQGTNSKDRLIGAKGIVQALLQSGAMGLISTHDLALTEIGEPGDHRLRNMHFQDRIEDGAMRFDFRLREGTVTKSNGVELMRLVGLKV